MDAGSLSCIMIDIKQKNPKKVKTIFVLGAKGHLLRMRWKMLKNRCDKCGKPIDDITWRYCDDCIIEVVGGEERW